MTFYPRFEYIAKKHGIKIAIEYYPQINADPITYNYNQLLNEVIQMAAYLQTVHSIKRGDVVGIYMDKHPDSIICILALMKLGATFSPIPLLNSDIAKNQRFFLVQQSVLQIELIKPKLIIINKSNERIFSNYIGNQIAKEIRLLTIDTELTQKEIRYTKASLSREYHEYEWAYIMPTSGSSGAPKLVRNRAAGLLARIDAHQKELELSADDKFSHLYPLSFDGALMEILIPLGTGGCCCPLPKTKVGKQLLEYFRKQKITAGIFLPHVLDSWVLKEYQIEKVVVMGDKSERKIIDSIMSSPKAPNILVNGFGVTELLVANLLWRVDGNSSEILLGRPVPGVCARVYRRESHDEFANESQLLYEIRTDINGEISIRESGIAGYGELYLTDIQGGPGEYLDQNLNKEKFTKINNEVYYKTGDMVFVKPKIGLIYISRYFAFKNEDGNMIYPERVEKEIKNIFEKRNPTAQGKIDVIVDCDSKSKKIHMVLAKNEKYNLEHKDVVDLQKSLQKKLPMYMIPSSWEMVAAENLDKNEIRIAIKKGYITKNLFPADKILWRELASIEEKMVAIWRRILGIESELSIYHRFFDELGASSLDFSYLESECKKEFKGYHINVDGFVKYQTISYLSKNIRRYLNKEIDNATLQTLFLPKQDFGYLSLFLIHPGDGDISVYDRLGAYIADRAIFALRSPGLDDIVDLDETVEEMSERYAEIIASKLGTSRECVIGGFSAGGIIGVEVKYLLEKKYQIKSNLLLFDTQAPAFWQQLKDFEYNQLLREFFDLIVKLNKISSAIFIREAFECIDSSRKLPIGFQIDKLTSFVLEFEDAQAPLLADQRRKLITSLVIAKSISFEYSLDTLMRAFSPETTYLFTASQTTTISGDNLGWHYILNDHVTLIGDVDAIKKSSNSNVGHLKLLSNERFLGSLKKTLARIDQLSVIGFCKKAFVVPVLEARSLYFLDLAVPNQPDREEKEVEKYIEIVESLKKMTSQAIQNQRYDYQSTRLLEINRIFKDLPNIFTKYRSGISEEQMDAIKLIDGSIQAINENKMVEFENIAELTLLALYNIRALLNRSLKKFLVKELHEPLIDFTICLNLIEKLKMQISDKEHAIYPVDLKFLFGTIYSNVGHLIEEIATSIKVFQRSSKDEFLRRYSATCRTLKIRMDIVLPEKLLHKLLSDFGLSMQEAGKKIRGEDIVTMNGYASSLSAYAGYLRKRVIEGEEKLKFVRKKSLPFFPRLTNETIKQSVDSHKSLLEYVYREAKKYYESIEASLKERGVLEKDYPLRLLINFARLYKNVSRFEESIDKYNFMIASQDGKSMVRGDKVDIVCVLLMERSEVYYLYSLSEENIPRRLDLLKYAKADIDVYFEKKAVINVRIFDDYQKVSNVDLDKIAVKKKIFEEEMVNGKILQQKIENAILDIESEFQPRSKL